MIVEIAKFLMVAGVALVIVLLGLLHAFFPINDKETTPVHRWATLAITLLLVGSWLTVFK